mgnify:CR=1 FL=1
MMKYTESETVNLTAIRWFIENCMEIRLPNGKTIVVDPMMIRDEADTDNEIAKHYVTDFSTEDLEGCDYILLTHIHGDHIGSLKQVSEKFHAPILVNGWSAYPLAKYLDLPLGSFIPMTDGEEYRFDGFQVKWLQGRHTEGVGAFPPSKTQFGTTPEEIAVNQMGTIYNSNFVLTLDNGITLGMDGGRYEPNLSRMDLYKPNILFCHCERDLEASAEKCFDAVTRSGAQYLFPLCTQIQGDGASVSAETANEKLKKVGHYGRVLTPQPGRWIHFSMGAAV